VLCLCMFLSLPQLLIWLLRSGQYLAEAGSFSFYHHFQTFSVVYTDGCFRYVLARTAMSVELLFYVLITHRDALLLRLGQIRNNAHFSFLVSIYMNVEHCQSNCHDLWYWRFLLECCVALRFRLRLDTLLEDLRAFLLSFPT
jgi:hypothetical protein